MIERWNIELDVEDGHDPCAYMASNPWGEYVTFTDHADSIEALERRIAELEPLAVDAGRYRFLRDHSQDSPNVGGAIHFSFCVRRKEPNQWCIDSKRGDDMDAAIDAELAKKDNP